MRGGCGGLLHPKNIIKEGRCNCKRLRRQYWKVEKVLKNKLLEFQSNFVDSFIQHIVLYFTQLLEKTIMSLRFKVPFVSGGTDQTSIYKILENWIFKYRTGFYIFFYIWYILPFFQNRWIVVPYGLRNAPTTFQIIVNNIREVIRQLRKYLIVRHSNLKLN